MTLMEAIKDYPDGQIFGVGATGGYLFFGSAQEIPGLAAEFDRQNSGDSILTRRVLDVYPSLSGPVVFVKLAGREWGGKYWDYDEWREAHGEAVEKKPIKLTADGANRLAAEVVNDMIKQYRRHLRNLKAVNEDISKRRLTAYRAYVWAWLVDAPEYMLDGIEAWIERSEALTANERDTARAVERDEKYIRSDDFGFYANNGGEYVIKKARQEAGL